METPDDVVKRLRAASRFRTVALIIVVALIASVYLGPRYSLFAFALPVAITAIALYYFKYRTPENTDHAVMTLGALLILFAWYGVLAGAHDRGQHRDIERIVCQDTRGENAEYRCSEVRNVLATPLSDDPD